MDSSQTNMREWQKGIVKATETIPETYEIQKVPIAALTVLAVASLLFALKPPFLLTKKRLYEVSSLHWPMLLAISCSAGLVVANAACITEFCQRFLQT